MWCLGHSLHVMCVSMSSDFLSLGLSIHIDIDIYILYLYSSLSSHVGLLDEGGCLGT